MSPEQVRSTTNVDQRTDVWSLGVIIYELLSAKLPFEAASMSGMFAAIVASPMVPLSSRRADLSPELCRAVERALVKEAEGRYQSVAELASALAPFGGEGARISVQRVTRQLGASGWEHAVSSTGGVGAVSQPSAASTTGPHVASRRSGASRGLALVIGAVVLAVGAAAAGAYFVQQRAPAEAAASPEPPPQGEIAAVPAPTEAAAPAPSTGSPAVEPEPSASAAPPPAAAPPALAPVAARAPRKPRPQATARPSATATAKVKFDPLGGAR
jgi:serine/threonine-protein kinase